MSFFITEKRTEEWLELERRDFILPDGSKRALTETRLTWRSLDYITETSSITEAFLIEEALAWGERQNLDFSVTFPNVLVFVHRELRYQRGID